MHDNNIYVQHLTNILPIPLMKVGGFYRYPYRPTLHWSLLGTHPLLREISIDLYNGKKTENNFDFTNVSKKYAIIEPIHQISHKIIGGIPEDLYSLGEHIPSNESYIFIPINEQNIQYQYQNQQNNDQQNNDQQNKHNIPEYLMDKIIYYENNLIGAIKNHCMISNIPMVTDISLMLPLTNDNKYMMAINLKESLNKLNEFCNHSVGIDTFIDDVLSDNTNHINNLDHSHYCTDFILTTHNDSIQILIDCKILNIIVDMIDNDRYLQKHNYFNPITNDMNKEIVKRRLMMIYKETYFLIVFNNGSYIKFSDIFHKYNIPFDMFNTYHTTLLKIEQKIMKIMINMLIRLRDSKFDTLEESHNIIQNEYKTSMNIYTIYLNEKIHMIPDKFRNDIKFFFLKTADKFLSHFMRTLEIDTLFEPKSKKL